MLTHPFSSGAQSEDVGVNRVPRENPGRCGRRWGLHTEAPAGNWLKKKKKKLNEMFFKDCCVYFPCSLFLTWSAAFNRWNFKEIYLNEKILADRVWGCQDCAVGEDTTWKAVLSGSWPWGQHSWYVYVSHSFVIFSNSETFIFLAVSMVLAARVG